MLELRADRRDQLAQAVPRGERPHREDHPPAVTTPLLIGRDGREEGRQRGRLPASRSAADAALEGAVNSRRQVA